MLEMNVKWDDIYDWEETTSTQSKQISMDRITSTSGANRTYSCGSVLNYTKPAGPTASTESSSFMSNVPL